MESHNPAALRAMNQLIRLLALLAGILPALADIYIVSLKDGADISLLHTARQRVVASGGKVLQDFALAQAFQADMPPAQLRILQYLPVDVEPDHEVHILK